MARRKSEQALFDELSRILGPEYMAQYLPKEDMIAIVEEQIKDIRKNEPKYAELKNDVNELKSLTQIQGSVETLFNAYEKVKKVSMHLRKIFSQAGINLDKYNSIEYSLYYEGQRYATAELKPEWLEVSEDGKQLKINMQKSTADIAQDYKNRIDSEVSRLIKQHYENYYTALTNMSLHEGGVMTKKGFNRGHVSEAYEEHMQEHHENMIRALGSTEYVAKDAVIVKHFQKEAEDDATKWYMHESDGANMMWQHLRHALGNQAGTVAGDVGGVQVKSIIQYGGKFKDYHSLSLTNLSTLENGINNYSAIFSDEDTRSVATKVVDYMTESITRLDRTSQSGAKKIVEAMTEDVYRKIGMARADEIIEELSKRGITLIKM